MNFTSEYGILYFVLSLLTAVTISFLHYRKTKATFPSKLFLISLRALVIFLLLSVIFITFITYEKKTGEKPINVFLIDKSKSMTLENRGIETEKSLELIKDIKNDISENVYFTFSGDILEEFNIKSLPDLKTDGFYLESTNLTKPLNNISKILDNKRISTVNIVSDGIINEGGNPEYLTQYSNTLFNYLLIGDTIQKNDLSIKNVFFNPDVYTEIQTKILVEFYSHNFNKEIRINLLEEDKLIEEKKISVNTEKTDYTCTFNIKSEDEGIKRYKVIIENESSEITDKNNSEEFFIKYTDNKLRLLVLSGNPSADFSYLAESIKRISNLEAKYFVQKAAGIFYEGQLPAMDEFNLLLLINFPTQATDLNLLNEINENLGSLNLPVFFISGSNTDYERLKILSKHLPFSSYSRTGNDNTTSLKLTEGTSLEKENLLPHLKFSGNLPEVFIPGNNFALVPEAGTLIYSSKFSRPVLVLARNNERNSAAFFAYDFYRWRLNPVNTDSRDLLGKIISDITYGICEKEKSKKLYIDVDKQIFSPYEVIKLTGNLNISESSSKVDIKIQVYNSSFSKEIGTTKTSKKSFSGELKNLLEGEYFVKAILYLDGIETANDIKKILVKESNREYIQTKADNNILNILSSRSSGGLITEQGLHEINKKIESKNDKDMVYKSNIQKKYLNSSIALLFFIIVILIIEWFIRKRINLP